MKQLHSHTLASGQIAKGNVFGMAQLSAKFQIWAAEHGTTDAESLAAWILEMPEKHTVYFSGTKEVKLLAANCFQKISGIEIPVLE
jgi:hypothetical protein